MFAQHVNNPIKKVSNDVKTIKCEKTGTIYYEKDGQQAWTEKELNKSSEKNKK
jgi:hypothetical protein